MPLITLRTMASERLRNQHFFKMVVIPRSLTNLQDIVPVERQVCVCRGRRRVGGVRHHEGEVGGQELVPVVRRPAQRRARPPPGPPAAPPTLHRNIED